MKAIGNFVKKYLHILIVLFVAALCTMFLLIGHKSENGYITLDGSDAKIEESTKEFIEDAQKALERITNQDKPTDEETTKLYEQDEVGLGFYTTIDQIIARRLPDGDNDNGKGWQCSKYTAYLATGKREYSTSHPDYGPVNGKDVAEYLVKYYGFKYIDKPVAGAIGSGMFDTKYGHTVMYLYSTGSNTAMVNDANWTPLKVSTHNMNIAGWKWVVPGNYNPDPTPTPTPTPTPSGKVSHTVVRGETLGQIIRDTGYAGSKLFGNNGLAQRVADENNIKWRGLIYPNTTILIDTSLFKQYN